MQERTEGREEAGGAAAERFARAWGALDAALDWPELGRLLCHEGGDERFAPDERAALLEAGLRFADDLGALLPRGGRTLWVGASVAELVPLLVEGLCLGREVVWREVEGPVPRELARALALAERACGLALPRPVLEPLETLAPASCDHLWLVSVLSDPEHFPALHDHLYGRAGGELAAGGGDLARERARAAALVDAGLRALRTPGWITTTDEELALVVPRTRARGLALDVPERGRVSAVVGDVVRTCAVRPSRGPRRPAARPGRGRGDGTRTHDS